MGASQTTAGRSASATSATIRTGRRFTRRLRTRIAAIVLVALGASATALAIRHTSAVQAVEQQTIDLRFALRGRLPPRRDIVIVALDVASLHSLPHYPFSRRIDARVLENLHRAGARVIVDDVVFDAGSGPGGSWNDAADTALYDAAQVAAPVVFAATSIYTDGQTPVLGGGSNVSEIGDAVGAALLPSDSDGIVRHLAGAVYGLPSLASQATRIATGRAPSAHELTRTGAWIDYAGPRGTYPQLRFSNVYSGHFDRAAVRGRIVIVGATALVLHDLAPTPVGGADMSGPEIEANAVATMLDGLPLRNAAAWLQIGLVLLAAFGVSAVALRAGALWVGIAGVGLLAVWCGATVVAFDAGTVLEFTPELVVIVLATGGAATIAAVEDARERRQLRQLFAAGSPALVGEVLSGDSRLRGWASRIIDGYRLEEQISRGGMGAVYRATQLGLGRTVALKVILPEHAQNAEHRARFELESRAAAAIEHPNVIPVYDTGDEDRVLYIAMRLVSGGDLSDELDVPLDPARAIRIAEQIAGALDAAHALNIVHRDVKPSNVLITSDEPEHVYLTDFGIAKWRGESQELTRADAWLGTATYAAPEQIRGEEVDGRADVYALAGVLHHCLTGEVPYPRDSRAATAVAHLSEPPPRPSVVNPTLPVALDAVMARGLAKRPGDRFETATALVIAAAAALDLGATLRISVPARAPGPGAAPDGFSALSSATAGDARTAERALPDDETELA